METHIFLKILMELLVIFLDELKIKLDYYKNILKCHWDLGWKFLVASVLLCQIASIGHPRVCQHHPRDIWVVKPCSGFIALNSRMYLVQVGWS